MRRTLHAATLFLALGLLASACLLDAGPYGDGGGGTAATSTSTGGKGGAGATGATGGGTTGGGGANPACGNGKTDTGEECDLGSSNDDEGACTTMCRNASCGDGFTQVSNKEACDLGGDNNDNGACTTMCKVADCGDGFTQASNDETCDLADLNSDTGACTTMCKIAACGDGLVHSPVEDCDGGGVVDKGCDAMCHSTCGDGYIVGKESCEDGNGKSGDGCSNSCQIEKGSCGNGRVDPDEVCDTASGPADCDMDCTVIDPTKACGKAVMIPPDPPNPDTGVVLTHFEGDTTMMPTPPNEVMPASCFAAKKPKLFTYKTGPRGSIVTFETKGGSVGGEPTFTDTVLWAYRDCLGKKAQEDCNNDIDNAGGDLYSKIQTGYLPPHTTLFVAVAGQADAFVGKFIVDIKEQPVTLLLGATFDTAADVASMTASDVGADGAAWQHCDSVGNCSANTTESWSGKGHAIANDMPDMDLAGETLTTAPLDAGKLSKVYVQWAHDFSQKGGGGSPTIETFAVRDSTNGASYSDRYSTVASTTYRQVIDASAQAGGQSTYSVRFFYDDAGGPGNFARVDDLYVYGY